MTQLMPKSGEKEHFVMRASVRSEINENGTKYEYNEKGI